MTVGADDRGDCCGDSMILGFGRDEVLASWKGAFSPAMDREPRRSNLRGSIDGCPAPALCYCMVADVDARYVPSAVGQAPAEDQRQAMGIMLPGSTTSSINASRRSQLRAWFLTASAATATPQADSHTPSTT